MFECTVKLKYTDYMHSDMLGIKIEGSSMLPSEYARCLVHVDIVLVETNLIRA